MNIEEQIHRLQDRIFQHWGHDVKINLYIGMAEWRALYYDTPPWARRLPEPNVRAQYAGMDIYRVDAESHLTAHLVEP